MSDEPEDRATKRRYKIQNKASRTPKGSDDTTHDYVKEAGELAEAAVKVIENVAEEAKETASDILDSVNERTKDIMADVKKDFDGYSNNDKGASGSYSDKIVGELKDPAVSTTVLFTAVTASAASTYLTQQHKQGKLTALVTVGVVIGVAALSAAEYFSVKAYFKRNSTP